MRMQFGILSYATEPRVLINVYDDDSDDSTYLLGLIEDTLKYADHKDKSGTNIKAALDKVYEMMVVQERKYEPAVWNTIQHVIILLTDGKSNMGGRPVDAINKIKELLAIRPNREDYLDVYAFGIGAADVDKTELSDIASQKDGEKHVFILNSAEDMKTAFHKMLEIRNYGDMCGLNDESPEAEKSHHHPWTVQIDFQTKSPCKGSLISKSWVLSAAHCFKGDWPASDYSVKIGGVTYKVKEIKIHDCYDLGRKSSIGITEDYDYDVALVQLETPVTFSKSARPICIPCTELANKAMKRSEASTCKDHSNYPSTHPCIIPSIYLSTCKDHKEWLLQTSEVSAGYISNSFDELQVKIKNKQARDACVSRVRTWEKFKTIDPSFVVSPRHLCVEGDMSCKGESGGPLFVNFRNRRRFLQVGVISWGLYNPCKVPGRRSPAPLGSEPRDFHLSVLEVLPWLRKHLTPELSFLPDPQGQEETLCPA
ncbi:complement C2-like isoform X1 [Ascaphus truei]|uniref:complement C2-like isoform X1 n=1 Tax=Ascaphus truei TaxID=8439 RepID=UPI003F5A1222